LFSRNRKTKKLIKDSSNGEPFEWSWEDSFKTAIRIGISPSEYEKMTPYELNMCIEAYEEKTLIEQKEKVMMMWMGEYFHRQKRLESLEKSLKKIYPNEDNEKTMSDEEMLKKAKELNALFGGTVTLIGGEEVGS
jgi:hypothetical protein